MRGMRLCWGCGRRLPEAPGALGGHALGDALRFGFEVALPASVPEAGRQSGGEEAEGGEEKGESDQRDGGDGRDKKDGKGPKRGPGRRSLGGGGYRESPLRRWRPGRSFW